MIDFAGAEKKRNRRIIFVLFCSLLIVFGSGIIAGVSWMKVKAPTTSTTISTVNVPALVGRDIAKGKLLAISLGLHVKIDKWIPNKIYPINSIVTQKPLPGRPILRGGTIVIRVSSGAITAKSPSNVKDTLMIHENAKPLPKPAIQAHPSSDFVVVIDAGHQEHANLDNEPIGPGSKTMKPKTAGGTRGTVSRIPEYEVTLKIAQRLEVKLKALGVTVLMTRTDNDVNMSNIERAEIANKNDAALFVRIHCDGTSDRTKSGISVLYPQKNQWTEPIYEPSLRAASFVHDQLISATAANDHGVVARNDLTGFNWSKVPAILIETGFLTNPSEEASLNSASYQDLLAKALSEGIIQYLRQGQP